MEYMAAIIGLAVAAVALATALAKIIGSLIGRVAATGDALAAAINGLNTTLLAHHESEHDWARELSREITAARDYVVREVPHELRQVIANAIVKRDAP